MRSAPLVVLLVAACSDDGAGIEPWELGSPLPGSGDSSTGDGTEGSDATGEGVGASSGVGTWSAADGSSSTDDGDSSGGASSGTTSLDAGQACPPDPHEPNDSAAQASDLGEIEDCDGDGLAFAGMLDGPDDVDWMRYSGNDVAFCVVNPARWIEVDAPLRLCKFADCHDGGTEVSCIGATQPAQAPDGTPGCCGSAGFEMGVDCPGQDDDADILLRLDQAEADCVGYTLAFHY